MIISRGGEIITGLAKFHTKKKKKVLHILIIFKHCEKQCKERERETTEPPTQNITESMNTNTAAGDSYTTPCIGLGASGEGCPNSRFHVDHLPSLTYLAILILGTIAFTFKVSSGTNVLIKLVNLITGRAPHTFPSAHTTHPNPNMAPKPERPAVLRNFEFDVLKCSIDSEHFVCKEVLMNLHLQELCTLHSKYRRQMRLEQKSLLHCISVIGAPLNPLLLPSFFFPVRQPLLILQN